jgi:hypothetical protein
MLWRPGWRIPIPDSRAEWFGLSAGIAFALNNVLVRKAVHHALPVKSTAAFIGVVVLTLAMLPVEGAPSGAWRALAGPGALWLVPTLGLVLLVSTRATPAEPWSMCGASWWESILQYSVRAAGIWGLDLPCRVIWRSPSWGSSYKREKSFVVGLGCLFRS